MENRIWTDGEGLTFSTLTNLLDEHEDTAAALKDYTLDQTDNLFLKLEELKEAEKRVAKIKSNISFLKGNIKTCIICGQKQLGYEGESVKYIHDKQPKTVAIKVSNDSIEVTESNLTM